MFKARLIAAGVAGMMLVGCASFSGQSTIDALKEMDPQGSEFTQHLARDYSELAHFEWYEMLDYPSGEYFAQKALTSATGEVVAPEEPMNWDIADEYMDDLTSYRARLVRVLDMGAGERAPDLASTAQVRYDCWVEQQEENVQPNHIAECRGKFEEALAELEAAMLSQEFMLFFDFDSTKITREGHQILDAFVKGMKGTMMDRVEIVGHTDTSGAATYNQSLSEARAVAVRNALVARGVSKGKIYTRGVGETDLLVDTADGVREPSNRRAVIILP